MDLGRDRATDHALIIDPILSPVKKPARARQFARSDTLERPCYPSSLTREAAVDLFPSGVYYVQVPAGAITIDIHGLRGQAAVIRPPVTELSSRNTD